jgi:hypothetical protein
MDLSDLLSSNNTPGLLTDAQQQGNSNSDILQSMGAAMLRAAAPSPFKNTTLAGIGDAVQAGVNARRSSQDDQLKRLYMTGQIRQQQTAQTMQALQLAATYRGLGLPVPAAVQKIIDAATANAGTAGGNVAQLIGQGQPAQPTPFHLQPTVPTAPADSAGAGSPAGLPAQPPAPQSSPTPVSGAPGGVMGAVQSLPVQDRWGLVAGGPIGEMVKGVATENLKKTNEEKNAAASGQPNPLSYEQTLKLSPEQQEAKKLGMSLPVYQAYAEGVKAIGAAKGKQMSDAVDAASHAQKTLLTLNNMEDALQNAPNDITTGPGAKEWLKVKQFASNLGFDAKGLNESEVVDKLNAFLAGEATKQISSRPAQFEFQTYLKNNPGLMTSLEGTRKLISIMRQGAQLDVGLGKIAGKEENLKDWGDLQDDFYRKNPIISPFTGKPVDREHPAVPPPLAQAATPTPPAAAAANVPTATDPRTGHTVRFIEGRWQ